jgi:hypothetical protein
VTANNNRRLKAHPNIDGLHGNEAIPDSTGAKIPIQQLAELRSQTFPATGLYISKTFRFDSKAALARCQLPKLGVTRQNFESMDTTSCH